MLDRLLDSVSKIRFNGGLVGRVCTALMVLMACITALGIASANPWLIGGAMLLLVVVAVPVLLKVFAFAEQNPNAAILDGAEFVKAERLRQSSKGIPEIPVITANKAHPPALRDERRVPVEDVVPLSPKEESEHE